jgi:hypothetical protein
MKIYLFRIKLGAIFQKKTSKWLDDHHIDYCKDWPTKGIDMNVIENVWGTLEHEKRAKVFYLNRSDEKIHHY